MSRRKHGKIADLSDLAETESNFRSSSESSNSDIMQQKPKKDKKNENIKLKKLDITQDNMKTGPKPKPAKTVKTPKVAKPNKKAGKEVSKIVPPKDTSKDTSKDIPKVAAKVATKEAAKNATKKPIKEDIQKDVPKVTPKDVPTKASAKITVQTKTKPTRTPTIEIPEINNESDCSVSVDTDEANQSIDDIDADNSFHSNNDDDDADDSNSSDSTDEDISTDIKKVIHSRPIEVSDDSELSNEVFAKRSLEFNAKPKKTKIDPLFKTNNLNNNTKNNSNGINNSNAKKRVDILERPSASQPSLDDNNDEKFIYYSDSDDVESYGKKKQEKKQKRHRGALEKGCELVEQQHQHQLQEDQPQQQEQPQEKGSIEYFTQVINLLNSLFGAAILNIPNSFTLSGIIPSFVISVVMAILNFIATHMTLVLQKRTNSSSLNEMVTKLMGRIGSNSLLVFSLFYSITGQIVFAMVGGIMLETWLRLANIYIDTVWRRVAMIGIYMFVFPIPLTIPRKKCYLSYFPPVTMFAVTVYFFAMIVKSVKFFKENHGISSEAKMSIVGMNLFASMSVYSLTFALPIVLLPTIKNYDKNVKSRSKISGLSIVLCFLILYIPGLLGYLQFGQGTQGNILMNYPDDDELILVTRIGIFTIVSFAYVGFGNLSTNYLAQLIFKEEGGGESLVIRWKRAVVLLLVDGIPLLITMFFTNAGPALWIGGAMGGCVVDFMFPAIMWILKSSESWFSFKNLLCLLFALFGFVIAAVSTYMAIAEVIKDFS